MNRPSAVESESLAGYRFPPEVILPAVRWYRRYGLSYRDVEELNLAVVYRDDGHMQVTTIGLRELRQDASELVRRVENGEQIDITVAGRLAARLVPATPKQWQPWSAVAEMLTGPPDPNWEQDRDLVDQSIASPWDDA